jgi:hypothetical protein
MRPNFAPFMAEVNRPEAHGLVIALCAKLESAPVAWKPEDFLAVLTSLAACAKKRGQCYEDVSKILDDCADAMDNIVCIDDAPPERFYQQDAEVV